MDGTALVGGSSWDSVDTGSEARIKFTKSVRIKDFKNSRKKYKNFNALAIYPPPPPPPPPALPRRPLCHTSGRCSPLNELH